MGRVYKRRRERPQKDGFIMKKKLIFGLALLFLATAYTFAQDRVFQFQKNMTSTEFENYVVHMRGFTFAGRSLFQTKVPNYVIASMKHELSQYSYSTGDVFHFGYEISNSEMAFIILRVTNAQNGDLLYYTFKLW